MKHKLALGTVVCLAVIALAALGASPAAAATCVDCHAAPPDGPPAPHDVLVAGVACATCHKGMSPHATAFWSPWLGFEQEAGDLSGRLAPAEPRKIGWFLPPGIPDVTVYLQQRLWGAAAFTPLIEVTTGAAGAFTYTVPSPAPWAAYRAIAQGAAGPKAEDPVRLPKMAVWLPVPKLTLKLGGLRDGVLRLGRTLKVSGTVAPKELEGKAVLLGVQRRGASGWVKVKSYEATISVTAPSTTGAYSWSYTPKKAGMWRIHAALAATPDSRAVTTTWRKFEVR